MHVSTLAIFISAICDCETNVAIVYTQNNNTMQGCKVSVMVSSPTQTETSSFFAKRIQVYALGLGFTDRLNWG